MSDIILYAGIVGIVTIVISGMLNMFFTENDFEPSERWTSKKAKTASRVFLFISLGCILFGFIVLFVNKFVEFL